MNRLSTLSLIIVLSLSGFSSRAQAPFSTTDSSDINNIIASVMVHGDMWWDVGKATQACHLSYSPHMGINFAAAIWMSGYDAGNNLHVAAQTYRQDGNDYWPGPLETTGPEPYTTAQKWAKIWKVDRSTVDSFRSISPHATSNTPSSILRWPGKGNAFAQGNAGAPLVITTDMAPFVDLNNNGIYEPLLGEYPDFTGEQVLWWVFNDNGPAHNCSNGTPLGIEVHAMAYGYHRHSAIDNVLYYDYTFINKSAINYHNFRCALWDDADLGYYLDDFIGFDSSHRMGIDYNGTNDDGASGGHPVNSYGKPPPVEGVTMIVLPGDASGNYIPAGSFDYYNNDASVIGNPANDTECNNYMRAKLRNGQHFTDDYLSRGIPSHGYGSGSDCNYVFPGDPSDTMQWSECVSNNNPGDRRFLLAGNDVNLNAGATQHMVMALVVTDSTDGGCPSVNFTKIKAIADTAWNTYYNPLAPLKSSNGNNNGSTTAAASIAAFPNPAHDVLTLQDENNNINDASITVYNDVGKIVYVQISRNGRQCQLDISQLTHGLYNVVYYNGKTQTCKRFMKE